MANVQQPTGTLENRIARLQKEFKPDSTGAFLNFLKTQNSDELSKAALLDYVEALERLEAFVKNGHTCEGLWFEYQKA